MLVNFLISKHYNLHHQVKTFNHDLTITLRLYEKLHQTLQKENITEYLDKLKLKKLKNLSFYNKHLEELRLQDLKEHLDDSLMSVDSGVNSEQVSVVLKNFGAEANSNKAHSNQAFDDTASLDVYAELNYMQLNEQMQKTQIHVADESNYLEFGQEPVRSRHLSDRSLLTSYSEQEAATYQAENTYSANEVTKSLTELANFNQVPDSYETFLEFLVLFRDNSNYLINFLKKVERFAMFYKLKGNGNETKKLGTDNASTIFEEHFSDRVLSQELFKIIQNYLSPIYNYLHFIIDNNEDWYEKWARLFNKMGSAQTNKNQTQTFLKKLLPLGLVRPIFHCLDVSEKFLGFYDDILKVNKSLLGNGSTLDTGQSTLYSTDSQSSGSFQCSVFSNTRDTCSSAPILSYNGAGTSSSSPFSPASGVFSYQTENSNSSLLTSINGQINQHSHRYPPINPNIISNLITSSIFPISSVLDKTNLNKVQYQMLGEDSINFYYNFTSSVGLSSSYCSFYENFDSVFSDDRDRASEYSQSQSDANINKKSQSSTLIDIDIYFSCHQFYKIFRDDEGYFLVGGNGCF